MRINKDSYWDTSFRWEYESMEKFAKDVEMLDKAHKRAKKELRKQQKALAKKNEYIKCYKEMYASCVKQNIRLERLLTVVQDKGLQESEENKTLRKEHSKYETEVQRRIIQSMNDTIVELRTQLNETEEKYKELLKYIVNEK